jgi:hypothetical protein
MGIADQIELEKLLLNHVEIPSLSEARRQQALEQLDTMARKLSALTQHAKQQPVAPKQAPVAPKQQHLGVATRPRRISAQGRELYGLAFA